jgi:hypothetical protein
VQGTYHCFLSIFDVSGLRFLGSRITRFRRSNISFKYCFLLLKYCTISLVRPPWRTLMLCEDLRSQKNIQLLKSWLSFLIRFWRPGFGSRDSIVRIHLIQRINCSDPTRIRNISSFSAQSVDRRLMKEDNVTRCYIEVRYSEYNNIKKYLMSLKMLKIRFSLYIGYLNNTKLTFIIVW